MKISSLTGIARQRVHHPVHHRPAGDFEQRLGNQMGVGPEPGSLPRERDHDLHDQALPYRSVSRTTSSSSGVDASSTSVSEIASSSWIGSGSNANRFSRMEPDFLAAFPLPEPEEKLSLEHVQRFVLHVVVLAAQRMAGLHMEDLPDIAIGSGPDQLVPPGLLDLERHRRILHRSSAMVSVNEVGEEMHSRTQTPHPTQPSRRSTG